MSDTGYVTSGLARAIASATSSKIDAPDGGSYQFHRFAFGERGDFIPAPLLDEIVAHSSPWRSACSQRPT
jgi:hypothetical protein